MTENLEVVRRAYETLNRGDAEAAVALCHPDIVLIPLRVDATGPFHGHDGMRAFYRDNAETFDHFEIEPREFRDLGEGRVLVLGTVRVRAHGSDAVIEQRSANVFWMRDGKVSRIEGYGDERRALEAVGA